MSTTHRKIAARHNLEKARRVASERAHGLKAPRAHSRSTAAKNRMPDSKFAFPKERKEPIGDARHVRNALSRFTQVKGVSVGERDQAWRRIRRAARRFGVTVNEHGWRELLRGPASKKR
jgi:hypothetical protein